MYARVSAKIVTLPKGSCSWYFSRIGIFLSVTLFKDVLDTIYASTFCAAVSRQLRDGGVKFFAANDV